VYDKDRLPEGHQRDNEGVAALGKTAVEGFCAGPASVLVAVENGSVLFTIGSR
jgi:hypothetical protein